MTLAGWKEMGLRRLSTKCHQKFDYSTYPIMRSYCC
jgi:hypothetical protein